MSEANGGSNAISIVLSIIIGSAIIGGAVYFGLRYQADTMKNKTVATSQEKNVHQASVNKNNIAKTNSHETSPSDNINSQANTENNTESANSNSLDNPSKTVPAQGKSDEELIKEALLRKTNIPKSDLEFEIADNTGTIARGTVKNKNEMAGAGWFATKNNNTWTVTYVGQGVPQCSEVNPYNYPISWVDYCINSQGQTVHR